MAAMLTAAVRAKHGVATTALTCRSCRRLALAATTARREIAELGTVDRRLGVLTAALLHRSPPPRTVFHASHGDEARRARRPMQIGQAAARLAERTAFDQGTTPEAVVARHHRKGLALVIDQHGTAVGAAVNRDDFRHRCLVGSTHPSRRLSQESQQESETHFVGRQNSTSPRFTAIAAATPAASLARARARGERIDFQ